MDLTQQAVTIVGAGTQGSRLAFMWSRRGRQVYLVDKDETQLENATKRIDELRKEWPQVGDEVSDWGVVIPGQTESLQDAVNKSWMLIECLPEIPAVKKRVLKELDDITPSSVIIASNSSSYAIQDLIEGLDLAHKSRFINIHSYFPPETPAVEVMGSKYTSPDLLTSVAQEAKFHGFSPYVVRGSSTGYIYNRIWAAIKRETLLLLAEGVASAEEVDAIFKDVLKTSKGPCELMDTVGLDVVLDIENHYAATRNGLPEEPRKLLQGMLVEKKLGIKSGRGFYSYSN